MTKRAPRCTSIFRIPAAYARRLSANRTYQQTTTPSDAAFAVRPLVLPVTLDGFAATTGGQDGDRAPQDLFRRHLRRCCPKSPPGGAMARTPAWPPAAGLRGVDFLKARKSRLTVVAIAGTNSAAGLRKAVSFSGCPDQYVTIGRNVAKSE